MQETFTKDSYLKKHLLTTLVRNLLLANGVTTNAPNIITEVIGRVIITHHYTVM